jgi:hypothetical protein
MMIMAPLNLAQGRKTSLRQVLLVACAVCGLYMLCPEGAPAEPSSSVRGLAAGERDAMRVGSRTEGREERILDSRLSDQKIGYEERKIRLERRAEELLRQEESMQSRQDRFAKEKEEARAAARLREAEDIKRKKRTVNTLPDL